MLRQAKTSCSELLKESACSSNATVALQTACQFGLKELHETSLAYIENNTGKCLSSEHIMQLPKECMEIILRSELLSCSETDILKCLLQWAEVRCTEANQEVKGDNLRNIIGNLLPLVRFPLVEKEYFATVISDRDLLTQPEIVSVFRSHYGVRNIFFSENIRKPLKKRTTSTLTRHGSTTSPWTSRGIEALKITPDSNIWLKGIVMFGPSANISSSKQHYSLEILNEAENVVSALKGSISEIRSERQNTLIPRPVYLRAHTSYTLVVKDLDVNTYYGTNCKASFTANGVTVIFETSPLCTTETDKDKGQIAGIVFCK
jgi:BTB/POZ domain-containing protein 1/2